MGLCGSLYPQKTDEVDTGGDGSAIQTVIMEWISLVNCEDRVRQGNEYPARVVRMGACDIVSWVDQRGEQPRVRAPQKADHSLAPLLTMQEGKWVSS